MVGSDPSFYPVVPALDDLQKQYVNNDSTTVEEKSIDDYPDLRKEFVDDLNAGLSRFASTLDLTNHTPEELASKYIQSEEYRNTLDRVLEKLRDNGFQNYMELTSGVKQVYERTYLSSAVHSFDQAIII